MGQKFLTSEEINKIVNETIQSNLFKSSMAFKGECPESFTLSDAPSKDGCLQAFGRSLSDFIEKKCPSSILKLKLNEDLYSEEDRCHLENVASSISGITKGQLMVNSLFYGLLFHRSYILSVLSYLKSHFRSTFAI